jgi:hypothetical protein
MLSAEAPPGRVLGWLLAATLLFVLILPDNPARKESVLVLGDIHNLNVSRKLAFPSPPLFFSIVALQRPQRPILRTHKSALKFPKLIVENLIFIKKKSSYCVKFLQFVYLLLYERFI